MTDDDRLSYTDIIALGRDLEKDTVAEHGPIATAELDQLVADTRTQISHLLDGAPYDDKVVSATVIACIRVIAAWDVSTEEEHEPVCSALSSVFGLLAARLAP